MDWMGIVKTVAPAIGTALGGPMVGTAVKVLGSVILGKDNATQDEVQQAIDVGVPPEIMVRLREADNQFKVQMAQAGLDIERINAQRDQAVLADVQDARKAGGGDANVFRLGAAILITFAGAMGLVLWGCFAAITGGLTIKDPAAVASIFTFLGTVVGYVASNAQQVVSFFFGSSRGSDAKTAAMADAMRGLKT